MGSKHSRAVRHSAPGDRPRRSVWQQRVRLSAPCERVIAPRDVVRAAAVPTTSIRLSAQTAKYRPKVPLYIQVMNLRQNEKLSFPLVLIEGIVDNLIASGLPDSALYVQAVAHAVEQGGSPNNSWVGSVCWPVVRESGHFKAYVHLPHPGDFIVRLRIANTTHPVAIQFAPRRTKWIVRFHYQKPRDSYQGFDAPNGVDNSDGDACQRLQFNAMVLQTAVAELFHRAGFARKTFAVELDVDGFPVVDVLRSNHSVSQARGMTDAQLLKQLNDDVQVAKNKCAVSTTTRNRVKHVVLLGGSHFDARTQKLSDYRTLVGGSVVATSVCGLFTWPRNLNELTACCFNSDSVAPELTLDRCSVGQTYWTNYSGCVSILLHLLGLSFGLSYRAGGVMHKRFRQASRLLAVLEPRPGRQQGVALRQPIGDGRFDKLQRQALKSVGATKDEIYLDELSIGELAIHCRWINPRSKKRMHAAKATTATAA